METRRKNHLTTIQWYQHRITSLKQPEEPVKSMKVVVATKAKAYTAVVAAADVAKKELRASCEKSSDAHRTRRRATVNEPCTLKKQKGQYGTRCT